MSRVTVLLNCFFVLCLTTNCAPPVAVNSTSPVTASSALVASPSSVTLVPSGSVALTATGGNPPYFFTILTGLGSVNYSTGLFVATSTLGSTTVQISDSSTPSLTANMTITVSNSGGAMNQALIKALSVTPEGTHVVGGGGCPNAQWAGEVADAGGGTVSGDQAFCESTSTTEGLAGITGIEMTPEGTHIPGGVPCSPGYAEVGAVVDCGGGSCYGDQLICVSSRAITSGTQYVSGLYISGENQHISDGGGCPDSSYTEIGAVADCGDGTCEGNQVFCIQMATAP